MTALLKYDTACRAIAEAKTFDEVRDWENKAEAIREYSRRAHNRGMELDCLEIRERARRRRGELLLELKSEGQLQRGRPNNLVNQRGNLTTLESLGLSFDESSRDQQIAAIEESQFETLLALGRARLEAEERKHSLDVLRQRNGQGKADARVQRERLLGEYQSALPQKKFGVILADPEWRFEPWSRATGMDRAADNHYPTSCTEVIAARDVPSIAARDCVLFLWATAPMLPHALIVMAAWGFDYRSQVIWQKIRLSGKPFLGTGYWFRNAHELLLVGVKGNIPAPAMGTQEPSIIEAPIGEHSAKPEDFLQMIEDYFPTLPKIELNRRGPARPGWSAWGNESEPPIENAAELMESPAASEPACATPQPSQPTAHAGSLDIPENLRRRAP